VHLPTARNARDLRRGADLRELNCRY
jgi:hypothetical protein